MPNLKQTTITTTVDERGNKKEQSINTTFKWASEPAYVKLYLQDIVYLSDLPSKHAAILYELLKRATYASEGMQVTVNAAIKRLIQANLGFKNIGTVSNAITDLVKGQVLKRVDTGLYEFNTYLFGKGDWADISKLRLNINYNLTGKTFKAVIEYGTKKNQEQEATKPSEEPTPVEERSSDDAAN